jgi:hypothetical protein
VGRGEGGRSGSRGVLRRRGLLGVGLGQPFRVEKDLEGVFDG